MTAYTLLNTAAHPAQFTLEEKKSVFTGYAAQCATVEEALTFVELIREEHPKARHVAFAALIHAEGGQVAERMSDDGEPSGTAGRPLLEVLHKAEVTDCAVCVVRYFGGILLGAPGLMRAYGSAAREAVKRGDMARLVKHRKAEVSLEYAHLETLERLISQYHGVVSERAFTDRVTLDFSVPESRLDDFATAVTQAFNAHVGVAWKGIQQVAARLQ